MRRMKTRTRQRLPMKVAEIDGAEISWRSPRHRGQAISIRAPAKEALITAPSADTSGVIARLDPKSGLPDFGIKLSKSETSDFDAIQYPRPVVTGSPRQARRWQQRGGTTRSN